MADLVLDVTGSSEAVRTSVGLVRRRGRLVLGGLTGHGTETSLKLEAAGGSAGDGFIKAAIAPSGEHTFPTAGD